MKKKTLLVAGLMTITFFANNFACTYAAGAKQEKIIAHPDVMPDQYEFKIAKLGTNGQLIEEYKLSKYDVINLLVVGFPNGIGVSDIMVGPDGYVQLPYAGTVKLAGLTLDEAKDLLKEKLGEYIHIPDMSIMIKSYGPRKVYVMGEVRKPGVHEMAIDHMNVYAALSSSGGVATHGRPKHVQVIRVIGDTMYYQEVNMDNYIKKHDMNQNLVLQDGDIIYVPRSNKIDLKEDVLPYVSVFGVYKNLTN